MRSVANIMKLIFLSGAMGRIPSNRKGKALQLLALIDPDPLPYPQHGSSFNAV